MIFPSLVYKDTGPHQRASGTFDYMLVDDLAEFNAALDAGWYASLPEAINPPEKTNSKPVARIVPKTVPKA